MKRYRVFLAVVYVACLAAGVWGAQRRPVAAGAQEAFPTPGQLEIVGKAGKPAGLCPLKHTSVNADISGYVARVTVTQEFTNPSATPVEAVYTFPLPADAAVDDMTMTIGRRIVKGEIRKKEEARLIYESAKAAGQAAALLDQERPNIFTQSVANIMPGDRVNITISYVNLLKYQEGVYEFVFPMVVGPRYVPGGGYTVSGQRGEPSPQTTVYGDPGKTSVVTDAHKITPPITPKDIRAGHDISVTVNLDAGLPLTAVRSTLHQVAINQVGRNRALVKLKDQATIPNKDFILKFSAAGSEIQSGILTHSTGSPVAQDGVRIASLNNPSLKSACNGYFTLIVQPPAAPPQEIIAPKEMVFVIDQTGSQAGWPIEKAKETMRYCMKNMNPGDTFQLLAFNTENYPCFDRPVPNTKENVQKALKFLEPLQGSGGTDILKAVDYALKIPDDPGRLRIICYMTDGYVGNDMQIIDYVKKYRGRARMFPFGVGNSVNRFLIDGMAREGRGVAEYVTVEMNTGAVMGTSRELTASGKAASRDAAERFYNRIASPLLLDPTVEFNGLPVEDVYPKHIPDVFSAGPVIVKGRYTHGASGDITIRGLLRGQPWSQTIHVDLPALDQDGGAIKTLWAREKIEDLQNQDWLGAQTGNANTEIKHQIESVALEYRLMSQYTSFVAVEPRVVNMGGKQRTIDVPVEMPEGVSYDGIFGGDKQKQEGLRQQMLGRAGSTRALGALRAGASVNSYGLNGQANAPAFAYPASGGPGGGRGGVSGKPAAPPAATTLSVPQTLAKAKAPAQGLALKESLADLASVRLGEEKAVEARDKEATKKLADMKPEDRRAVLRPAKLSPELLKLFEKFRKGGVKSLANLPEGMGKGGYVEVQIWLNDPKPDQMAKLESLMSKFAATLTLGKLVLGVVHLDRLDVLIELPFVGRIELPKYN